MLLGVWSARFEYCSAVSCSAADTHIKLLDRVESGTSFLTGDVFKCGITHRRSVVVLCMLYKFGCNLMYPFYGTLPVSYAPVRVTRRALDTHRYTYAPPRCRTSHYRRTFIPLSVSLWNDLANPVFDGVIRAGFKRTANDLLFSEAARSFFVIYYFPFLSFLSIGWYCGVGVFVLIGCK